ncbi:MAG: PAS domain S-box protein [Polyangiales bacterium]
MSVELWERAGRLLGAEPGEPPTTRGALVEGIARDLLARLAELERENGELRARVGDAPSGRPSSPASAEERMQEALLAGHSFTFDWDPITDRVVRSESCGEILGLAGEAAVRDTGRGFFDRVHPDDRARFEATVGALTPEAATYAIEYRAARGDGRELVLEERGRARFDVGGKMRRLFGVTADVTERRRMETALRRSEARYRLLHESLRDGFVQVSMDGRIVDCNDVYCAMLGYTRDEIQRLTYVDLTPARWHEAEAAIVREQILPRGYSEVYEKEYRRKGGEVFPVELRTILARDEGGRPVAMWALVRDITGREAAREELRRQQRRLEEESRINEILLGSLPGLFCLVDGDGRVLRQNRGIATEGAGPGVLALVARALREGEANADLEFVGGDGRRAVLDVTARRVEIGGSPCALVTGSDVTARNTELRTKDEQLRQAQRLESVGRLAGGVAHDFNNLMSVVLCNADFALDELRDASPLREDILDIRRAGQRAAALTRQLLAFSRKQVLSPQALDLNKVIADVQKMLARLLGEDIDIALHLAGDLGSVLADPGQLEQVIVNLCVNARDAMPHGGRLTVETARVERALPDASSAPGPCVMLSIADTGCGMPPEVRDRVFEPFFTTKELGKGTGLGLSTVYGIVKQSGGDIRVESEPGRGTTFEVYLPRVDAPAVDVRPRPVTAMPTGSEAVLIVEDEDTVRRLAERVLRKAGYDVLAAANGGEALLLSEKHGPVDLLLTDVVMPHMSGRELADRLARASPGLGVLYMSGYTDDAIVHHGVLEPGARLLAKPFSAAELTRKVREALDAR